MYKSCGPLNEPSCGSAIENDSFNCREGCFCPDGHMLNSAAVCVKPETCPCESKGKSFPPKSQVKRDCNTCTCVNGNWKCTDITCGARCAAIGDPHYSTFDGKRYDFMGKCSYILMKAEGISVEAENVACSGAISENMNFLPSVTTELPSCTKSLTIKFNDAGQPRTIKLKQGGFVLLDGFEVSKLPKELSNGAVRIRQASSSFVIGKSCFFTQVVFLNCSFLPKSTSRMERQFGGTGQREHTLMHRLLIEERLKGFVEHLIQICKMIFLLRKVLYHSDNFPFKCSFAFKLNILVQVERKQ